MSCCCVLLLPFLMWQSSGEFQACEVDKLRLLRPLLRIFIGKMRHFAWNWYGIAIFA
ncbi:hypothetical protein HMPREF9442_03036 [Paraprevotella xylaniphila YIT 11841]|uniref:Uncharacterized protein n=1 Tax=Paraprevotella xylaniphila YIT 11841 TaxID=762982 RepID=F3QXU6_9BACT|nr:hypothetical protein HMPREF9442_03036 [Paraprevotella xylaniphila YIT 11841]